MKEHEYRKFEYNNTHRKKELWSDYMGGPQMKCKGLLKDIDFDIEKQYGCKLPKYEKVLKYCYTDGLVGNLCFDFDTTGEPNIETLNAILDNINILSYQNMDTIHMETGILCITEKSLLYIYNKECYKIPLESIVWYTKGTEMEKKGFLDTKPVVLLNVLLKNNTMRSLGFIRFKHTSKWFSSCTDDESNSVIEEIKSAVINRRKFLVDIIKNRSDNFEFEEPLLKQPKKQPEKIPIDPEYKRTCKICGKVWYSSVAREKEIESGNITDDVRSFCAIFYDHSTKAQLDKNMRDRKLTLDEIRTCPECHSNNYNEEIIEFIPMNEKDEKNITQNVEEENPEKLLKLRLAKGEITIDEYKDLKEILS